MKKNSYLNFLRSFNHQITRKNSNLTQPLLLTASFTCIKVSPIPTCKRQFLLTSTQMDSWGGICCGHIQNLDNTFSILEVHNTFSNKLTKKFNKWKMTCSPLLLEKYSMQPKKIEDIKKYIMKTFLTILIL